MVLKGLTREEVASRVGVSSQHNLFDSIRTGKIKICTLTKVCQALGITVHDALE